MQAHALPSRLVKMSFLLTLVVKVTCSSKSVAYFLGNPAENCIGVCVTRGMSCVKQNAFPKNSFSIFASLNISCTTVFKTNWYYFPDQPNLIVKGPWKGRCTGIWGAPYITNCTHGHNLAVRRLCPCEIQPTTEPVKTNSIATTTAFTTKATTTAAEATTTEATPSPTTVPVTTLKTATTSKTTTDIITGATGRSPTTVLTVNSAFTSIQNKTNEERSQKNNFKTWKIIVMVVVLLVVCAIALLFLYKRKRKREPGHQKNEERSQDVVYQNSLVDLGQTRTASCSGSKDYICDVIDDVYYSSPYSTKVPTNECCYEEVHKISSTDNILYDRSSTDNILYDSADKLKEKKTSTVDTGLYVTLDENPIFGNDVHAHAQYVDMEQSGIHVRDHLNNSSS